MVFMALCLETEMPAETMPATKPEPIITYPKVSSTVAARAYPPKTETIAIVVAAVFHAFEEDSNLAISIFVVFSVICVENPLANGS